MEESKSKLLDDFKTTENKKITLEKEKKEQETTILKLKEEKILLEKHVNKLKNHKKESHDLKKELETLKTKY